MIHATWNLWAKQVGGAVRTPTLMFALTLLSAVLYGPAALTIARESPAPGPIGWLFIAGSGVLHVVYFVVLMRGYRRSDLSVVYPVARGTGPLLAAAGAITLFAERATALSLGGALAIAAGVAVLTLRSGLAHDPRAGAGVRWGLATGALIGVYTLWDGWAVQRVGLPPLLYYWCGEVVRVLLFAPLALRDREGLALLARTHAGRVFGIAALSPLGYIFILLALRDGAVSHIAPAREVSILFGAWLGGAVLGEHQRRRRLVAAGLFAAGVIALALA